MPSVHAERHNQVVYLTIDRPPLNVLDLGLLAELRTQLAALQQQTSLRAVVLRGAGRAFCAGVDVADHTPERVPAMLASMSALISTLYSFPCPTVALLQGHVLGGGLELALACDVVIARQSARLGLPEIKLGVFAPYAAVLLPALVGRQAALQLLYSGEPLEAEQAQRLGLVQLLVPDGDDQPVEAFLRTLEAQSASALRLTKRAVLESMGQPLHMALRRVVELYEGPLLASHDAHEGLAAFIEKRAPRWKDER